MQNCLQTLIVKTVVLAVDAKKIKDKKLQNEQDRTNSKKKNGLQSA